MNIFSHVNNVIKYLNNFFNPIVFIISLCVGILCVYAITPPPKVIVKYPTPENSGRVIYKDEAHNCFKIISSEVNCPEDSKQIKSIPLNS